MNNTVLPQRDRMGRLLPGLSLNPKGRPPGKRLDRIEQIFENKKCNPVEKLIELLESTKDDRLKFDILKELLRYGYSPKRPVDELPEEPEAPKTDKSPEQLIQELHGQDNIQKV